MRRIKRRVKTGMTIQYNGVDITPEEMSLLAKGTFTYKGGTLTYYGRPIDLAQAEQIARALEAHKDKNYLEAQLAAQDIRIGDRVLYIRRMYTYNGYEESSDPRFNKHFVTIYLNNAGFPYKAGTPLRRVHSEATQRLMTNIPMAVNRRTARNVITKGFGKGISAYSPAGKTMRNFLGPANLFVRRPPHSNRRRAGSTAASEFRNPRTRKLRKRLRSPMPTISERTEPSSRSSSRRSSRSRKH
jgi:hypothetical protein